MTVISYSPSRLRVHLGRQHGVVLRVFGGVQLSGGVAALLGGSLRDSVSGGGLVGRPPGSAPAEDAAADDNHCEQREDSDEDDSDGPARESARGGGRGGSSHAHRSGVGGVALAGGAPAAVRGAVGVCRAGAADVERGVGSEAGDGDSRASEAVVVGTHLAAVALRARRVRGARCHT